jgi:hypothetical protein
MKTLNQERRIASGRLTKQERKTIKQNRSNRSNRHDRFSAED